MAAVLRVSVSVLIGDGDPQFLRLAWGSGKVRIGSNPRNRYDAAFKGHMTRRANELCWALRSALSPWCDSAAEGHAVIKRVIAEIEAIRDEVARTTPEHHPPTAS